MGGSSGVIPERAEIHVGVALDDAARQGVGGGSGRLAAGAGPQVNGVTIRVVLRGRGKAGLPEIHLQIHVWNYGFRAVSRDSGGELKMERKAAVARPGGRSGGDGGQSHLEVVVLDLEAGEEDERDDRRHDAAAARLVLHRGGAQGLDWPGVLPTPALPARGGGGGLEARRVSLQREKGKVLEGGRVLERKENGGREREGGAVAVRSRAGGDGGGRRWGVKNTNRPGP